MVFFLIGNISLCLVQQRRTDGEGPIAFLPGEFGVSRRDAFNPLAAFGLDCSGEIGHSDGRGNRNQGMHMVGYTANNKRDAAKRTNDATYVIEQAWQVVTANSDSIIFDMEYQVDIVLYK